MGRAGPVGFADLVMLAGSCWLANAYLGGRGKVTRCAPSRRESARGTAPETAAGGHHELGAAPVVAAGVLRAAMAMAAPLAQGQDGTGRVK